MDLEALVAKICDQADTILASATTRAEAKEDIAEWLTRYNANLSPADKKTVIAQALNVLDGEGFFAAAAGGDA